MQESGSAMNQTNKERPATVAATPEQAGETRDRWWWVESCVWTARMLSRLGSTGGNDRIWYELIDKVYAPGNLQRAWEKVRANGGCAGVDRQSIRQFERRQERELALLNQQLKEGSYRPQAARRVWIDKPGSKEKRPLGIPAVRDRVVQGALRQLLEPIFETQFSDQSYGFRPGRGAKDALRQVDALLQQGRVWVLDADLKSYFDTISHKELMRKVRERIVDGRVLELMENYLKAGVMEELKGWTPCQKGTPQGAVISPLLANLYLDELDHLIASKGMKMVRYADDFVILCESENQAQEAKAAVEQWVRGAGLELHPEKTRIVNASQPGGFDFLGYHFERGMKWPRKKSLDKLKDRIREKTKRTNGTSMEQIIRGINRTMRGWYEYFKHSKPNTFKTVDGYIRGRLRGILRKRAGKRGKGRGRDHQRWPNLWFESRGLFTLEKAHDCTVTILKLRHH